MRESSVPSNTLNRKISGLFRAPCPPPEDESGRDFFRVFVELDGRCYLELFGDLHSEPLHICNAEDVNPKPLTRIEDSRLKLDGESIQQVLIHPNGTTVVRTGGRMLLWVVDEEDGSIAWTENKVHCYPPFMDELRDYFETDAESSTSAT